jgi:hypothetical protein
MIKILFYLIDTEARKRTICGNGNNKTKTRIKLIKKGNDLFRSHIPYHKNIHGYEEPTVISHEDVCREAEMIALVVAAKEDKIFLEIPCALDFLLLISAGNHIGEASFMCDAVFPRYAKKIAELDSPVNNSIFKSAPMT